MTMSKDLLLSLLSMDSYNRGYGSGISDGHAENGIDLGLGDASGTPIGTAIIIQRADSDPKSQAQASGFYAIAYDTPFGTVISYRGTDNGPDYIRGWVMGAGVFPIRLKPDDWTSGTIPWLLDVVAPDATTATRVLANFRQVVKEGNLRLHPLINRLVDEETLKKMGAERMDASGAAAGAA